MAAIGYVNKFGILAPKGINKMMHADGNTSDIIDTIIYADRWCGPATAKMANQLRGATKEQTAKNVWAWVKKNIKYVLDPIGEQYVKDPAVTFKDGFADCKSRSIFQASLLKNLGIDYAYRFAAYVPGDYKHVYIVSYINGKEYISDPDMPEFNHEKPTIKHLDKRMSSIQYIAGIGIPVANRFANLTAKYNAMKAAGKTTPAMDKAFQVANKKAEKLNIAPSCVGAPKWLERLKALKAKKQTVVKAKRQTLVKAKNSKSIPPRSNRAQILRAKAHAKLRQYRDRHTISLPEDIGEMNSFDMDLALLMNRDQIQKSLVEQRAGVGCSKAEKFQDRIDMTRQMIHVMRNKRLTPAQRINGIGIVLEMIEKGEFDSSQSLSGIGSVLNRNKSRRQMNRLKHNKVYMRIKNNHVPQIGKIKLKKIFKNAGNAIKKGTKAFTKVVATTIKKPTQLLVKATKGITKLALKAITTPAKLAAKGTIELLMPKMAPTFLYLFIKDPALVAKLPAKAQRKRTKSAKLAKFITGTLGMKEDHFYGIARNGIMKHYGKSPEAVLSAMLGAKVSGIGILPIIAAVLPVIIKVVKLIGSVFGKKDKDAESYSANDIPDQSDFESLTPQESTGLSQQVMAQPDTTASFTESDNTAPVYNSSSPVLPDRPGNTESNSNYTQTRKESEAADYTSSVDRRSNKIC
jgi:hypothetical protein